MICSRLCLLLMDSRQVCLLPLDTSMLKSPNMSRDLVLAKERLSIVDSSSRRTS